ncbi:MAG: PfkB family carbohydrate kinase [Nitrosomonadales bacterium]
MKTQKCWVVGDVMLDRYWFGDVERISPEAPVPVLKVARVEERPGGAANVARNIAALGAHCTLLSVVGNDEAGAGLEKLLNQHDNLNALCTVITVFLLSSNCGPLRGINSCCG